MNSQKAHFPGYERLGQRLSSMATARRRASANTPIKGFMKPRTPK
jgi:hypothetical protein